MESIEDFKLKLLCRNIAKQRKLKKLSQNALSEKLDISREHLAKIETAKRGISIGLLFRVCTVLNISEQVLFDFSEPKQ